MNPNLKEMYKRPFRLIFSGVESKTHFDLAYSAGVRDYLMAILHCKKIKPSEMERRFGNGDCRLMIDSSTYTFHTKYDEWKDKPISYWEKFIEEMLDWIREHRDYVTSFVELDITQIVGTKKVKEWRQKYFLPFEEETGIPCLMMWQPDYGLDEWIDMCKRYRYVGFSGEAGIPDRQVIKMLQIARKYNCLVHGMAFTKVDKLRTGKYPFYSADSISWKSSEIYGVTYIFDGKNFIQFDKTQKHRRKKYKTILVKQGVDWSKVQADNASEVTRMALIAWTNVGKYLSDLFTRTGKAYWLKGAKPEVSKKLIKKKRVMDEYDYSEDAVRIDQDDGDESSTAPIFPPPEPRWETSGRYDWEEVAQSLNINPECGEDTFVMVLIDILSCLYHPDSEKHAEYLYAVLTKNEGMVDYIYDTYVEGNYEPETEDWDVLPDFIKDHLTSDDDFDEESATYNENSMLKLAYLYEIAPKVIEGDLNVFQVGGDEIVATERPTEPKERDEYAGDEDRKQVALVPRDENGRFLEGNNVHLKRTRSMLAHMPKLACDTCYAADSCPHFKPKSVCYYDKELKKFDTRNVDDIVELLADVTNTAVQRLMLARIFEQFDGGMPDRMVTDLINQVSMLLDQQRKVLNAQRPSGDNGSFQVTASGDVGNSIIAKLFGGLGETPKEERKDVTPTKKSDTISKIFDAEYEVIEDKPKKKLKKKKKVKK